MMGNPWSEEEKIKIKEIFLEKKKEQVDTTIKDMRNLFRLKKEVNRVNNIVLRNINNLSERQKEEENYYKPVRLNNFQSNNYIEYKSNGDKNKILSVEEYLNKIWPYLKDIKNDLKKSGSWKIQLTIAINSSSMDDNDEERVMHSKSDNI